MGFIRECIHCLLFASQTLEGRTFYGRIYISLGLSEIDLLLTNGLNGITWNVGYLTVRH